MISLLWNLLWSRYQEVPSIKIRRIVLARRVILTSETWVRVDLSIGGLRNTPGILKIYFIMYVTWITTRNGYLLGVYCPQSYLQWPVLFPVTLETQRFFTSTSNTVTRELPSIFWPILFFRRLIMKDIETPKTKKDKDWWYKMWVTLVYTSTVDVFSCTKMTWHEWN